MNNVLGAGHGLGGEASGMERMMRTMVGAIAASAFISCVIVLPGSFVSSAQSQQAPVSAALPAPAPAEAFDPAVCGAQGWPYYNRDCQRGGDAVRIIKIGQSAGR